MATFSLKSGLLLLLNIASFAVAQRRGGGSSDSDSSSSSGSDSGGSSSSGSSSRPKGTQHVEVSGNNWPYRWAGSYYNGTITLDTSIEYWPDCSERTRGTWRQTFDGMLHVGPGNWSGGLDDPYEPQFLLMGWDEGKIPTNNWTDGVYWGNGGPGLTRWFSTDVKLMLTRWTQIWHEENEFDGTETPRPYDFGWTVESDPAGNGTNQYSINGNWSGLDMTFQPSDNQDNNFIYATTTLCNNNSIIDEFQMLPQTWKLASQDWDTTENTTFRGSFSDRSASISWGGNYWAGFRSIDYNRASGVPFNKDGYPQGIWNLRFEGEIDQSKSDRLVARVDDPSTTMDNSRVGGPDWVAVLDREDNVPVKRVYYSTGTVHAQQGPLLMMTVAAVVALLVL